MKRTFRLLPVAAVSIFFSWGLNKTALLAQNPILRVSGIPYSINGQDSIPRGLFGVHSTTLTTERVADWGVELVRGIEAGPSGSPSFPGKNSTFPSGIRQTIDCYYDRYQPALYLSNRNGWKTQLENLATTYGNASLAMSHRPYSEFWNEPFLNWATKPGANYDNRWYDSSDAVAGGAVRRPGFTQPEKHLVWERKKWFVQLSPAVNDPVNFYVQVGNNWTALNNLAIGQELQIGSRRFKAVMAWLAKDTTQKSYFSSLANAEMYIKMYKAFAQRLKSVNPGQRVAAGWGMQIHQESWRPWFTQYKPTLDSCWQWMDGIHEHHYGGDTRYITAGYEVANAYSQVKYGKKLDMLNTESGGFLDPQIPGNVVPGQPSDPLLRDRGAFQYTFREILHHISKCPDKAYSRAAHEAHLNRGDGIAFRLLRDLRGRLISTTSTSDNVWIVASQNGNKLAVAVYNDNSQAQTVDLQVRAPKGFLITEGQGRLVKDSSSGTTIAVEHENFFVGDTIWTRPLTISQKSGRSFTLDLTGSDQELPMVIRQYFGDTVLARVKANDFIEMKVKIPAESLATAEGARLKINMPGFSSGGLTLNGAEIPLQNRGFFTYLPFDKNLLQPVNTLRFTAGSATYDLLSTSIEILEGNVDPVLLVTSTSGLQTESRIRIFPNPAQGEVQISGTEPGARFGLFDLRGRKIQVQPRIREGGIRLSLEGLPHGVYQLQVSDSKSTRSFPIYRE